MAIGNHPVQTNFVEIGRLKFEHLMNALPVNLISGGTDFVSRAISSTKPGLDQLLAVFVEQVECVQVSTGGNFDQLSETVTDLGDGKSSQKGKIEEGMHGSMVCTQSVLVVAIIDRHFDGYRGVYQANHSGRNPNKVGVPSVCSTSEPSNHKLADDT